MSLTVTERSFINVLTLGGWVSRLVGRSVGRSVGWVVGWLGGLLAWR